MLNNLWYILNILCLFQLINRAIINQRNNTNLKYQTETEKVEFIEKIPVLKYNNHFT